MKYCVNARCSKEILLQADEIFFGYKDTKALIDYIEKYPDKTFIYELSADQKSGIEFNTLKMYNDKLNGNFYIALPYHWENFDIFKDNGIKFYVNQTIKSFMELQFLQDIGSSYAIIEAPLTHKLDKVKKYNIPIRMCPNFQNISSIAKNGVLGGWVRPEDIGLYEDYVEVFELYGFNSFVKASLKIYKEGKWDGDLNFLIPDLKQYIDSRTLDENITKCRITCGQRCLEGGMCRICHHLSDYSVAVKQATASKKY